VAAPPTLPGAAPQACRHVHSSSPQLLSKEHRFACRYINYFVSKVDMMRSHGVEPWVVFDGGRLPIKGNEESSRHRWGPSQQRQ
jgi:hypothetical protein